MDGDGFNMNSLVIRGGQKLSGEIEVSGSKNIALAILSAVALAEEPVILRNVPKISDTEIKAQLLEVFGAKVRWEGSNLYIDCSNLKAGQADEEMVRSIRTSFYMVGPLLARIGKLEMPAPGGCKIGARPVDLHLKGLHALGAQIDLDGGVYRAQANKLVGTEVYLDMPSAGATQHIMSTAALAHGTTTITNAAMEPEIVALADFLNRIGAVVEGAGTSSITIQGKQSLRGAEFKIPADRIQAGTFLLAGAITGGDVTITNILPEDQTAVVNKLREAGAMIEQGGDWVRVGAPSRLSAVKITTMPHPGFPTDMQQPMAAVLCVADGMSSVTETIYESRTGHISELCRMGAKIEQSGHTAVIQGVSELQGATVYASDLRAGAALCLAGLVAKGETVVKNIHFIDRGYESIEKSLQTLGADISRVLEGEGQKVL
jgi:UDP-N-acetylglucosamine 1-carboxyvinyltransferase